MATLPTSNFGYHFLVEPSGVALTTEERLLLKDLRPTAFMFRSRNFLFREPYEIWLPAFQNLVEEIKQAVNRPKIIWSIDHEGGRVVRPPKPITRFPYCAAWGSKIAEVSAAMAVELSSLGLNVSFSPCADVDGGCSVIGQRSFSSDVDTVTKSSLLVAQTLRSHGIFPVAKHFPGNGFASADPHFGAAINNRSRAELERDEFVPFRSLIKHGVSGIMTAHVTYPELDPQNPATVSKAILHDLLRRDMGFNGVIFADALGMKAVQGIVQSEETILQAIKASLDIFVMVGDTVTIKDACSMQELLVDLVRRGQVNTADLTMSQQRIEKFIALLPQNQISKLPEAVLRDHQQLAIALDPDEKWQEFQYIPEGF